MKKLLLIFITFSLFSIADAQKFQANWASLNQRKNPS
jgi:hypothetical protein